VRNPVSETLGWVWNPHEPIVNKGIVNKGIFVMSDLFGIPEDWTRRVMDTITACSLHRFYLLTSQPQNLIKFKFPDNCWVGVSVTDNVMFLRAIRYLYEVEARIKYISFEPLLAQLYQPAIESLLLQAGINQVIIGAGTKPPLKIWVDEIIEACKRAAIPYFLRENLRPLMGSDLVQALPRVTGKDGGK